MNAQMSLKEIEDSYQFQLSKISHEIRNPVNLIYNYLQLLAKDHPEVKGFEYWDHVTSNMDFLILLLNEITAFQNSENIYKESINIYLFLQRFVEEISTELDKHNIQIHLKKESAIPRLDIDIVKFKSVLHNLIRNSVEAIGRDGNITIRIYFEDLSIVLKVIDDGPGIPEEYLPTLFEPFVTHKQEGTGLGLAIIKNIIDAHDGTISVESQFGEGTTFTIRLPL